MKKQFVLDRYCHVVQMVNFPSPAPTMAPLASGAAVPEQSKAVPEQMKSAVAEKTVPAESATGESKIDFGPPKQKPQYNPYGRSPEYKGGCGGCGGGIRKGLR